MLLVAGAGKCLHPCLHFKARARVAQPPGRRQPEPSRAVAAVPTSRRLQKPGQRRIGSPFVRLRTFQAKATPPDVDLQIVDRLFAAARLQLRDAHIAESATAPAGSPGSMRPTNPGRPVCSAIPGSDAARPHPSSDSGRLSRSSRPRVCAAPRPIRGPAWPRTRLSRCRPGGADRDARPSAASSSDLPRRCLRGRSSPRRDCATPPGRQASPRRYPRPLPASPSSTRLHDGSSCRESWPGSSSHHPCPKPSSTVHPTPRLPEIPDWALW